MHEDQETVENGLEMIECAPDSWRDRGSTPYVVPYNLEGPGW